MRNLVGIAGYTFREHIRHRIYLAALFFGALLMAGSLIISSLANEERVRMVMDVGLSGIELVALLTTVFTMATIVLQEIENKTIYVTLSHPIPRIIYLAGRCLGTIGAILIMMAGMALLHSGLLLLMGWKWQTIYVIALGTSALKILLMTFIALFFSLFSSSAPTAMTFSLFLWILGHFSQELRFLGEKSGRFIWMLATEVLYYVLPNFAAFNIRDLLVAPVLPSIHWYVWLIGYVSGYGAIIFLLAYLFFSRKEF